jgi:hypothetical protein
MMLGKLGMVVWATVCNLSYMRRVHVAAQPPRSLIHPYNYQLTFCCVHAAGNTGPELRIPQGWDSPAMRERVSGALAMLSLPHMDPTIGPYHNSTRAVVEYLQRINVPVTYEESERGGWPPLLREFLNMRLRQVNSHDLPLLVIEEAYGRGRLPFYPVSQGVWPYALAYRQRWRPRSF